jgi:hypothetical protein
MAQKRKKIKLSRNYPVCRLTEQKKPRMKCRKWKGRVLWYVSLGLQFAKGTTDTQPKHWNGLLQKQSMSKRWNYEYWMHVFWSEDIASRWAEEVTSCLMEHRQNFYQLLSISCSTVTHSRDTEGMSKCRHAEMCTEKILIFPDNRSEIFLNFWKIFHSLARTSLS